VCACVCINEPYNQTHAVPNNNEVSIIRRLGRRAHVTTAIRIILEIATRTRGRVAKALMRLCSFFLSFVTSSRT